MSIIPHTSPISLIYKVAIVTNASSALGVVVCKTLLKANALVLGVDSKPKDSSLSAGSGTHFQFLTAGEKQSLAEKDLLEACRQKFGVEHIDIVVNVICEERGLAKDVTSELCKLCFSVMKMQGTGVFVDAIEQTEHLEQGTYILQAKLRNISINSIEDGARKFKESGIRWNVIVPGKEPSTDSAGSRAAYDEARKHMRVIFENKSDYGSSSNTPPETGSKRLYDIANLVLFLAGNMSSTSGRMVFLDGSSETI